MPGGRGAEEEQRQHRDEAGADEQRDVARVVDPAAAPHEDILAAAEGCPTGAIKIRKDGQQL